MSTLSTSNITSGFIDLATFDEIEKYLYGGPDATAYFVRETRKSTWFTQVPVSLSRASGNPAFNTEWAVSISRAGDYLLQTWLRLTTPSVALAATHAGTNLRWTQNLMHNIIRECCITFNDLVAARFDNYHLDFWAAFTVPAGKQVGYNNMIGNTNSLIQGVAAAAGAASAAIPATVLNLPLPFFYTRDSGVALPTAALPYNEMRINFSFRNWSDLLILSDAGVAAGEQRLAINALTDLGAEPVLTNANVWADYAIVSNDERKRMACAPRDILIEQVQTAPRQSFLPANNQQSFDIRFSHAIKVLFFSVRNKTWASEWSNYMTNSPTTAGAVTVFAPVGSVDPVRNTSLIYENTSRLSQMGSDYFSLVNPYFHAPVIPVTTGYHMYSYSLDFMCLDPMGSTNYGKLTNVSIVPLPSGVAGAAVNTGTGAVGGAAGNGAVGNGADFAQTYEFIVTAVNNNIIRISGGALGFPVL
uniref:Major capsid protein n=1 Tax=viral metagenome TaxID=1070528 RepID=A0A6C0LWY8_9ZZZZ